MGVVARQMLAAQQERRALAARCSGRIAPSFTDDRFMDPHERTGEIYESLKLLLACVDALERRVAVLEGHSSQS